MNFKLSDLAQELKLYFSWDKGSGWWSNFCTNFKKFSDMQIKIEKRLIDYIVKE